uniref:Uncharacterized protein n=1 Tax=Myoviridae sp. ctshb19 TaxID=2825194 RepID=A0A8S5UG98_9CAUD|nr:MAG TPA: hypothetical protein [Myoviridae sp. ctshb19]
MLVMHCLPLAATLWSIYKKKAYRPRNMRQQKGK